jgi:hypothetical protein
MLETETMERVQRKPTRRRIKTWMRTEPPHDPVLDVMPFACVHWLLDQGYDRGEIASFLGLTREEVDILDDVEGLDVGVMLGPKAKLAQKQGLI